MTMTSATAQSVQLAIDGGVPVRTTSLPFWPSFEPDEIEAVSNVLRSGKINYWTGEEGRKFEQEYASSLGCKYAVALTNGTVALELALYVLGVGPGDDVVTTSRTFLASASAAVMRGARPVFADIDRDSQNVTASSIGAVLTASTKAIIVVHLAGWPCDMDPILALARARGIKVIEDCAQAHGATYKGRPVGSMGDVNAFSFCQDKIISTGGEGGLVVTNDESLWKRAWAFKDHGKSHDAVYGRQHAPGFRWLHESFGTNWRLTESQSALGRILLRKLPDHLARRNRNAALLNRELANVPSVRLTIPSSDFGHAYYKYYFFLRPAELRQDWNKDRVMAAINAEGIPCFYGSCSEIYMEKAFPEDLRPSERLPVARELGETALMCMVHPTLLEEDVLDTARAIRKVMAVAAK
jgi:dTDP-4-amino-4,6-dideoxygalactose transaminase